MLRIWCNPPSFFFSVVQIYCFNLSPTTRTWNYPRTLDIDIGLWRRRNFLERDHLWWRIIISKQPNIRVDLIKVTTHHAYNYIPYNWCCEWYKKIQKRYKKLTHNSVSSLWSYKLWAKWTALGLKVVDRKWFPACWTHFTSLTRPLNTSWNKSIALRCQINPALNPYLGTIGPCSSDSSKKGGILNIWTHYEHKLLFWYKWGTHQRMWGDTVG